MEAVFSPIKDVETCLSIANTLFLLSKAVFQKFSDPTVNLFNAPIYAICILLRSYVIGFILLV